MVREPCFSGRFYPGEKNRLIEEMADLIPDRRDRINAIGAVSPHAGYPYSGAIAGDVFSRIEPKGSYVVLSPNHSGRGARFAASGEAWSTPLGPVEIDAGLLDAVMKRTRLVEIDPAPHMSEHSVEVQLPFIQMTSPGSRIVPLTVKYGSLDEIREVALALAGAIEEDKKDAVVISSSDMTHYEPRRSAIKKDRMAIDKILALDPEGLIDVVESNDISMCGYIPTVIMLMCAKALNAEKAELVKYSDSGEVTGDTEQVVGYAGLIVY